MNRQEAALAGSKVFDSRTPCKRDGTTQRYTTNGVCCACAKARSKSEHESYRRLVALSKAQQQV